MITILDGPLGTELDARNVPCDQQSWSALAIDQAPEVIGEIHHEYAAAGATVHTANTFRTKRRNVGSDWQRLTSAAVEIARSSVPPSHRIAGSIAPLEDCYRPDLSPLQQSRNEHRELATTLVAAGADLLLCETFANPIEAVVAVEESVRTGTETWVALTAGPESNLITPQAMAAAAGQCVGAGAAAVLVNCTPTAETQPFLAAIAAAELNVPIGAYANAGRQDWQSRSDVSAHRYALAARRWTQSGATLIGGCCGTTPIHIAKLKALLQ